MACAFDAMGLKILSQRFMQQYTEENGHATKILHYVLEVGGAVELQAVPKPSDDYNETEAIVQAALEGELAITKRVNELVALAEKENDYATRSFLAWFIDEQVEEVSSMTDLLGVIRLANGDMLQVEERVRHDLATPPVV